LATGDIRRGELYEDGRFDENIGGALDCGGLDVGVYFFSQAVTAEEAEEEAEFVLDRLKGYDISYPVVFDWEVLGLSSAAAPTGWIPMRCAAAPRRSAQRLRKRASRR
jgi:hypothetical protein